MEFLIAIFFGLVVQAAQDGSFISSGYRSVAGSDILDAPFVIAEHRDVFHVGPVNLKRALGAISLSHSFRSADTSQSKAKIYLAI